MEEKLVKVLLDQYKEKGIDMYALLDDKFFMDLDLQQKVDLIKQHAAEISSGTSRGMTKNDIRNVIMEAAMSGLGTGLTAHMAADAARKYFMKGKSTSPIGLIAGATVLGAAVAAGNAYINTQKSISKKDDILKKIRETAKNPTDENALRVLTTRNHQFNRPTSSTSKGSASNLMDNIRYDVPAVLMSHLPHHIANATLTQNYTAEEFHPAPGHDANTIGDALDKIYADKSTHFEGLKTRLVNAAFGIKN